VTAAVLWTLLFLFVLRVAGQLAVFLGWTALLPPMEAWYSGLLPYGPLLVSQAVIIAVFAKASLDVTRGGGTFADRRPGLGAGLQAFALLYAAAMVVRLVIRVRSGGGPWWMGGTIPIVFHWVLAAFLLVLGRHLRRELA
jgi:hypothetical protein